MLRKASLICQAGKGNRQSSQERDEGVGVHVEECYELLSDRSTIQALVLLEANVMMFLVQGVVGRDS